MKRVFKLVVSLFLFISLSGCSSTRYNYMVNPTPLVKGKTAFAVKSVKVSLKQFGIKLTKGSDVKGYLSEDEMSKVFQEKLTANLKDKNILSTGKKDGYDLVFSISYTRTFALNSNKVLTPDFSYQWIIEKEGTGVASYASGPLKISGLKHLPGIFRTGSSDINPEAELEYIDFISKTIIEEDIAHVGK